jgi:hypothetical protein
MDTILLLLLVLWRFGPFSGHEPPDLPEHRVIKSKRVGGLSCCPFSNKKEIVYKIFVEETAGKMQRRMDNFVVDFQYMWRQGVEWI